MAEEPADLKGTRLECPTVPHRRHTDRLLVAQRRDDWLNIQEAWAAGGMSMRQTAVGLDSKLWLTEAALDTKLLREAPPSEPHNRRLSQMVLFHFTDEETETLRTSAAHSQAFCLVSDKAESGN